MKAKYFFLITFLFISQVVFSQNNAPFAVHEWGTFTTLQNSNGKLLSGLHVDEEKLPPFTFDFSDMPENVKGIPLSAKVTNVKVKMETPVLYFYSDVEQTVAVDVKFKNGCISQWYPNRLDGENILLANQDKIDFSLPRMGSIKWNATILAPTDVSPITTENDITETQQWKRPRATASNLIKVEGTKLNQLPVASAVEKFLFYRGVANFNIPVKVEFNTYGNLVLTNNFSEQLNFIMVYEKKRGQCASVWWSGTLNKNNIKVVGKPVIITNEEDLQLQMTNFENGLINAGLFKDEAKAMLNTWKESYFEHEGIKVFWIAPRSFTEEILPINITPQPGKLERVIVGRSEVLHPEFEKELTTTIGSYLADRFYLGYRELITDGIPKSWTTINNDLTTGVNEEIIDNGTISISPNPAKNQIRLSTYFKQVTSISIQIFNLTGAEIYNSAEKAAAGEFAKKINISEFADGLYFIKIQSGGNVYTQKIIKGI